MKFLMFGDGILTINWKYKYTAQTVYYYFL